MDNLNPLSGGNGGGGGGSIGSTNPAQNLNDLLGIDSSSVGNDLSSMLNPNGNGGGGGGGGIGNIGGGIQIPQLPDLPDLKIADKAGGVGSAVGGFINALFGGGSKSTSKSVTTTTITHNYHHHNYTHRYDDNKSDDRRALANSTDEDVSGIGGGEGNSTVNHLEICL